MKKLTPEQRSKLGHIAAKARWRKLDSAEQKPEPKEPEAKSDPDKSTTNPPDPLAGVIWQDAREPHFDRYVRWLKRQQKRGSFIRPD